VLLHIGGFCNGFITKTVFVHNSTQQMPHVFGHFLDNIGFLMKEKRLLELNPFCDEAFAKSTIM
jgi:hypothetical protein